MDTMKSMSIIHDVLSENDELGTIKINLEIFLIILKKKENDIDNIPPSLIKKSNDLQKSYNCFASNYDARSLWEKKKFIASKVRSKDYKINKPKLQIVSPEVSNDIKCKKEFTSYLNKLTDVNKNIIYNKIKIFIENTDSNLYDILFDIIWNFIKISSNNIYIEILYLFDTKYTKEYIEKYWNLFLDNSEWIPSEYILTTNILSNDESIYNEYCNYVKWKKGSISLLRAWCYILYKDKKENNIEILLKKLLETLQNYILNIKTTYKHSIDIILDQIKTVLELYNSDMIKNEINKIDTSILDNSSKFKIYNILEKK